MQHRLWSFIYVGLIAGPVAAILSYLDKPAWLILISVLLIIVVWALIQEALYDPTSDSEVVEESRTILPPGFGRALLEEMPLALIVISTKGRVVYGNNAATSLLPNLELGGHFINLFRAPAFVDAVNAALEEGESSSVSFTTSQGGERFFETRIGLLPAGSEFGDAVHAIVEIEDRTRHRQAENMRSDFIANASHELRTPLASIIGYIETLQGHAKNDAVAREKFLDIMGKQATRMQRLVDDLMSLSRIEANVHIAPKNECDLYEIVRETVAAMQPLLPTGVSLANNLPSGEHKILGDRDQINQVFVNLIDNAVKYAGEGNIEIVKAPENPVYPNMIGITVRDIGPGIAKEHVVRLTERFYRVNTTQSRNKGGTGLGLAIVKHIINRHKGTLQIESELGKGSAFTIWLPSQL